MKTLLLLRHAKSSWASPTLADHERPLKLRGVKASHRIGRLLRETGLRPERVLCSTAVRARETLRLVLQEADILPAVIDTERLYHCQPSEFAFAIQSLEDAVTTAMLVGHNPGLEEFLTQLTGQNEVLPTAALAQIDIDGLEWDQFTNETRGRLVNVWRPKELDDRQE